METRKAYAVHSTRKRSGQAAPASVKTWSLTYQIER
jgi:hypothetical protein